MPRQLGKLQVFPEMPDFRNSLRHILGMYKLCLKSGQETGPLITQFYRPWKKKLESKTSLSLRLYAVLNLIGCQLKYQSRYFVQGF